MKPEKDKLLLDKYATVVAEDSAVYTEEGRAKVAASKCYDYEPKKYSKNMVLWIPPPTMFRAEFEEETKKNIKWIRQMESNAKALDIDYCISFHKGGKSPYFNAIFSDMPTGENNKKAKLLLADLLMPANAKRELDKTNLGFTLSPIIGHPHWKPKYKGAVHKIIRGTHPVEHKNKFPKDLKKKLKNNEKRHKKTYAKTLRKTNWMPDFFMNYCTKNKLPGGARHHKIEKNMAALLMNHPDWDDIKKQYLMAQERETDTFRTWEIAILNGEFTEPNTGEIYNYIKKNTVPYKIHGDKEIKEINEEECLEILKKPRLIYEIHEELSKKHFLDHKEKLAGFFYALTGYLEQPHLRKTVNFLGDSSVGKDNLIKTILWLLPSEDALFLTRGTTATLEDDIANYRIIAFSELNTNTDEGANKAIVETLKQLTEGGTSSMKKDMNTRQVKHIQQEQKAILWSSTETKKDDELETRGTCITILADPTKTKTVNLQSCLSVSTPEVLLKHTKGHESPIASCIRYLKQKRRYVYCPFLPLIAEMFDNSNPRSQRDCKRFIAVVLSLAWIHQEQRKIKKRKTDEFVQAEPIDILRAAEIIAPFLNQTYKGYDSRIDGILEILKNEEEMSRAELQHRLNIRSVNTIKERIDILLDLDLAEYVYEKGKLVRENNSPVVRSLSKAYQKPIISLSINEIRKLLIKKIQDYRKTNDRLNDRLLIGYIQALTGYKTLTFDDKPQKSTKPIKIPGNKAYQKKNHQKHQKNTQKKGNVDISGKNDRLKLTGLKKGRYPKGKEFFETGSDILSIIDRIDTKGKGFDLNVFIQEYLSKFNKRKDISETSVKLRFHGFKEQLGIYKGDGGRWYRYN